MNTNLLNRLVWIGIPFVMLASLSMVFFRPDIHLQFADKVFIMLLAIKSSQYLTTLITEKKE